MVDTANVPEAFTQGEFRLGDAIGRTFSILGKNFVPFLILGAIATLPYLALYWAQGSAFGAAIHSNNTPEQQMAMLQNFEGMGRTFLLAGVIGFVLYILGQAIMLQGAFQVLGGGKVQIGRSLTAGLSRFVPILGLLICEGLGIGLGFILLFIPGLILLTMWYIALPACVVEKLGPLRSLGRSATLTKGHRWKLFGLIFLLYIVSAIISGVVMNIFMTTGGAAVFAIGQYAWQAVYLAFHSVLTVVIYHDLRVAKEGIDTQKIAAVFD